jgi:hypothetical protein
VIFLLSHIEALCCVEWNPWQVPVLILVLLNEVIQVLTLHWYMPWRYMLWFALQKEINGRLVSPKYRFLWNLDTICESHSPKSEFLQDLIWIHYSIMQTGPCHWRLQSRNKNSKILHFDYDLQWNCGRKAAWAQPLYSWNFQWGGRVSLCHLM